MPLWEVSTYENVDSLFLKMLDLVNRTIISKLRLALKTTKKS